MAGPLLMAVTAIVAAVTLVAVGGALLLRRRLHLHLGLASGSLVVSSPPSASDLLPAGLSVTVSTRVAALLAQHLCGALVDVHAARVVVHLPPAGEGKDAGGGGAGVGGEPAAAGAARAPPRPPLSRPPRGARGGLASGGGWTYYVKNVFRNSAAEVAIVCFRAFHIRVDDLSVSRAGAFTVSASGVVLAARPVGVLAGRFALSASRLAVTASPRGTAAAAALTLPTPFVVTATVAANPVTPLKGRTSGVLDDLRLHVAVPRMALSLGGGDRGGRATDNSDWDEAAGVNGPLVTAATGALDLHLCPGHTRALQSKLPRFIPVLPRPRAQGAIRYWDGWAAVEEVSVRAVAPVGRRRGGGGEGRGAPVMGTDAHEPWCPRCPRAGSGGSAGAGGPPRPCRDGYRSPGRGSAVAGRSPPGRGGVCHHWTAARQVVWHGQAAPAAGIAECADARRLPGGLPRFRGPRRGRLGTPLLRGPGRGAAAWGYVGVRIGAAAFTGRRQRERRGGGVGGVGGVSVSVGGGDGDSSIVGGSGGRGGGDASNSVGVGPRIGVGTRVACASDAAVADGNRPRGSSCRAARRRPSHCL